MQPVETAEAARKLIDQLAPHEMVILKSDQGSLTWRRLDWVSAEAAIVLDVRDGTTS